MSFTIESPTVEAVQNARREIRDLLTAEGGRVSVPDLLDRLRERNIEELVQTYAFGLMLSRNEVVVEDDVISFAQLDDEPSDTDVG